MVDTTIGIPCVAYHLPEHVDSVRHWARRTGQPAAVVAKLEQAGVRNFTWRAGKVPSASQSKLSTRCCAMHNRPRVNRLSGLHTHAVGSIAPPPASLPRQLCEHFGLIDVQSFSFAQQHCASSLGALRIIRAMFIASRPPSRTARRGGRDAYGDRTHDGRVSCSATAHSPRWSSATRAPSPRRTGHTRKWSRLARGMLGQTEARVSLRAVP